MTAMEDIRFQVRNTEFNQAVETYRQNDENAWSLLENRQQEIENLSVSNEKKAQAFDGVLAALSSIFPRDNTAYCQALTKRLAYTDRKNIADMERIAKDAYFHRRDVDIMLYGKIVYEVYKLSKDKDNFPYKNIAKDYRKKQLQQEKSVEREYREKRTNELDYYIENEPIDAEKKLQMIDEIINLVEDKYFGPVLANKTKREYCKLAVRICREELFDENGAAEYLTKANEYGRRTEKAVIEWEKRRGIPTKAKEKAYMYNYRSDNVR